MLSRDLEHAEIENLHIVLIGIRNSNSSINLNLPIQHRKWSFSSNESSCHVAAHLLLNKP